MARMLCSQEQISLPEVSYFRLVYIDQFSHYNSEFIFFFMDSTPLNFVSYVSVIVIPLLWNLFDLWLYSSWTSTLLRRLFSVPVWPTTFPIFLPFCCTRCEGVVLSELSLLQIDDELSLFFNHALDTFVFRIKVYRTSTALFQTTCLAAVANRAFRTAKVWT